MLDSFFIIIYIIKQETIVSIQTMTLLFLKSYKAECNSKTLKQPRTLMTMLPSA